VAVAAGKPVAGIDLGWWLAGEIAGREHVETIQLYIEYDPHPPLDAGHPSRTSKSVIANARTLLRKEALNRPRCAAYRRSPGRVCSTSSASGGGCDNRHRRRGASRERGRKCATKGDR
jgi:hypothetical protein